MKVRSSTPARNLRVKPFSGRRAFEEVSGQICELIYARKLKPGDKLPPERELAEMFKAGRTAIREGLRVLEQTGMIQVRRGSDGGSFIKGVDASSVSRSLLDIVRRSAVTVDHLNEVRIGVEKLVIASVMGRITKGEMDLLKRCIEDAEAMVDASAREDGLPDLGRWMDINAEFHLILSRATRNPLFEMIMESLIYVIKTFVDDPPLVPEFFRDHTKYHRAIFDAIRDKNLQRAQKWLEAHSRWIGKTLSIRKVDVEARQRRQRRDMNT